MNAELADIVIPSIFFFVAFFLGFLLTELMIILSLNRIFFSRWGLMAERLEASREKYGKELRLAAIILIVVVMLAITEATRVVDILWLADLEIKVLASETLLAMALVYLTATRRLPEADVEKSIHKYLYIYLSLIVFATMIILADKSYADYKDFINVNVTATVGGVEKKLEKEKKEELLQAFRAQLFRGKCLEANFLDNPGEMGVKHFLYITTSDDLKRSKTDFEADESPEKYFKGRICTERADTFLLTDYGQWYWVIDSRS